MKVARFFIMLGGAIVLTILVAQLGIVSSLEHQVLLLVNLIVLGTVVLHKHLGLTGKTLSGGNKPKSSSQNLSNTNRFVTNNLGLTKRRTLSNTFCNCINQGELQVEIGEIVTVVESIEPKAGNGKIRYKGLKWEARACEFIAPGEVVKITGRDVLTLIVEKIKTQPVPVPGA